MNLLYYKLQITSRDRSGHFYKALVKPSNLPFPSPLETEIFISTEDEEGHEQSFHVEVVGYRHTNYRNRKLKRPELGKLFMLLGVQDGYTDFLDEEWCGRDVSSENPEALFKCLLEQGWQEDECDC